MNYRTLLRTSVSTAVLAVAYLGKAWRSPDQIVQVPGDYLRAFGVADTDLRGIADLPDPKKSISNYSASFSRRGHVVAVHFIPKRSTLPPTRQSEGGENENGRELRYFADTRTWTIIRRHGYQ